MAEYQTRVLQEYSDLGIKIHALDKFLKVSTQPIKAEDRQLMEEQLRHMKAYADVLQRRIEAFQ